jgi:hypothetical protein
MRMSLGVLDHLGLNLYSNIPAVLSEVVANSWDADSTKVSIVIDIEGKAISITDDGIGMTADDLNKRFLYVGFRRREHGKFPESSERPVEGIAVIGTFPDDLPQDEVIDTLRAINARIITYDTLIAGALESYREYLDKHQEVSRLEDLLDRLEHSASETSEAPAAKAEAVKSKGD